jgi:hypothetical protein
MLEGNLLYPFHHAEVSLINYLPLGLSFKQTSNNIEKLGAPQKDGNIVCTCIR